MGGRGAAGGASGNSNKNRLPQLAGSEKQIKWASDIRNNFAEIQKMENKIIRQKEFQDLLKHEKDKNSTLYKMYKNYEDYINKTKNRTKASQWIDDRYKYDVNASKDMLERYMKGAEGRRKLISFNQYVSSNYDIEI